jgi:tripartite-type tricarboxylate transporter receptor subunit TctC
LKTIMRSNSRRQALFQLGAFALASSGAGRLALAQSYPSRAIRIVVPWAPGGLVDTGGRVVGDVLQKAFSQATAVENVPGAAGTMGAAQVAKAPPDGHTLLMATSSLAIDVAGNRPMQFDPTRDLLPVGLVADTQSVVIVPPSSPIKSIADLVKAAKDKPGGLEYGTPGIGSPAHLFTELFAQTADIRLLHVPYGRSPAINDLMGGRLALMFATVPIAIPQIRNGNVRALAVTGANRAEAVADVPTLSEAGVKGYEASQWLGVFAPAGTPADIVGRLSKTIASALADASTVAALRNRGLEPRSATPEQFARVMATEIEKWRRVMGAAGIKLS